MPANIKLAKAEVMPEQKVRVISPWVDISKPDYIAYHDHEWGVPEGGKSPENNFHFQKYFFIVHSPYSSPFSRYLYNLSLNKRLKPKSLTIVYARKTDGYKMFL